MVTKKLLVTVLMGMLLIAPTTVAAPPPAKPTGSAAPAVAAAFQPAAPMQAGYLVIPVRDARGRDELQVEPYYPRAGDILLYDYHEKILDLAFKYVGSGSPIHSAIVIDRPDGRPAILEIGANSRPQAFTEAFIVEVKPRLDSYPGAVMVRRPRQPLTPEQAEHLRTWSLAQQGKKFAVGRLALQGTPFNCRKGLRHMLFAHTYLDRDRWICSENVVAGATVAGLLDPHVHFANSMYPRDLAYDEKYDLSATYQVPVLWVATENPPIAGNRVYGEMRPQIMVDLPLVDLASFHQPQHPPR
jgi:hypothetical protein